MYIYFDEGIHMKIIKLSLNDTVELKKPHPCGSRSFRILRVGSDVRVLCLGCGHDMTLEREKLEKAIRSVTPAESAPTEDAQ